MLNQKELQCHEDLVTLETLWIIHFTYVQTLTSLAVWGPGGGGGGSIIRLGPSWFTSTLYLIIIYMSNIEAI